MSICIHVSVVLYTCSAKVPKLGLATLWVLSWANSTAHRIVDVNVQVNVCMHCCSIHTSLLPMISAHLLNVYISRIQNSPIQEAPSPIAFIERGYRPTSNETTRQHMYTTRECPAQSNATTTNSVHIHTHTHDMCAHILHKVSWHHSR
jgi:hypothetical protein